MNQTSHPLTRPLKIAPSSRAARTGPKTITCESLVLMRNRTQSKSGLMLIVSIHIQLTSNSDVDC